MIGRALLIASAWLLACVAAGCDGPEAGPLPSNRTSVVLISIDSLRADYCSVYGYRPEFAPQESTTPFLERMAAEGVLFENASASTSWTLPSHMSLLTGMACKEHGVRSRNFMLQPGTENLAGRLRRAGYVTGGFYSGPFLHGSWGFAEGFDHYAPASPYLSRLEASEAIASDERGALGALHKASHDDSLCSERVVDAGLEWLAEDERYERPFFLFLHLWDPHYDYQPPEEYARMFVDEGYEGEVDGTNFMDGRKKWQGADLRQFQALYAAEIRYTDDQIARLFAQLEEWGIADDVVFAVTSDHGEEFYEHGNKGHQKTLFEEVMHIPMLIRAPDRVPAGERLPQTVSLYDLGSTLLELAGVPDWQGRTGRSFADLWKDGGEDREVVMDLAMQPANRWSAWRQGPFKIMQTHRLDWVWQYNLEEDPQESDGRQLQSLAVGPYAKAAKRAFERLADLPGHADPVEITPEMRATLEEVGYVGDSEEFDDTPGESSSTPNSEPPR